MTTSKYNPITGKERAESLQVMFNLACEAVQSRDETIRILEAKIQGLERDLDWWSQVDAP